MKATIRGLIDVTSRYVINVFVMTANKEPGCHGGNLRRLKLKMGPTLFINSNKGDIPVFGSSEKSRETLPLPFV